MSENRYTTRQQVGIALRFPIVALLTLVWVRYLWWWIAGIGIAGAILFCILQPLAYPFIYAFTYIAFAFTNSKEEVLPEYFKGYPDYYIEFCKSSFKVGFKTLKRWLLEGFSI